MRVEVGVGVVEVGEGAEGVGMVKGPLSNRLAIGHMWLFQFRLIKTK